MAPAVQPVPQVNFYRTGATRNCFIGFLYSLSAMQLQGLALNSRLTRLQVHSAPCSLTAGEMKGKMTGCMLKH